MDVNGNSSPQPVEGDPDVPPRDLASPGTRSDDADNKLSIDGPGMRDGAAGTRGERKTQDRQNR